MSDIASRANWQPRDQSSGRISLQRVAAPEADENPVQVAYKRLMEHSSDCPTCRAVDEKTGRNKNLDCAEGFRVYREYRDARRAAVSA